MQILRLLRKHDDLTVDDLASQLGVTVPTVSRHLQLLRMQNLVTFDVKRCDECDCLFVSLKGEKICHRCKIEEEEARELWGIGDEF